MKSSAASAVLAVSLMAIGPSARADELTQPPGLPVIDEIVRALTRLPVIGPVLDPLLHPTTIRAEAKPGTLTFRLAPMITSSSIGIRAVGTF